MFFPPKQTPQQLYPLAAISFLEEGMFQKDLFSGEFAIGLDRVISCEPVRVETGSRKFLTFYEHFLTNVHDACLAYNVLRDITIF